MLTIKDLTVSKELDSKEMAGVTGGTHGPLLDFYSMFAPSNQYGVQESAAQAFTGPQSNATYQSDNDVIYAAPGSQALNWGGNTSHSNNHATAAAFSIPVAVQA